MARDRFVARVRQPHTVRPMALSRLSRVLAPIVLLGLALTGCGDEFLAADRQEQVRKAGSVVMPFDLDKTKHSFVKVDSGGVQTVVALDPADSAQVGLIRNHLMQIAEEFSAGNFSDPVAIHGEDMPGVQALAKAGDKLTITFREVNGGAEIIYNSRDSETVRYVHEWFDAQTADHGHDATDGPLTSGDNDHVVTEEMWRQHHPGEPYPGTAADSGVSGYEGEN